MKLLRKYVFRFLYPLTLTAIEAVLFAANYTSNTFLVGWDNVMPELNIKLNYFRALNSVWQDYRGLGTLDGMSHAANLVHTFYIDFLGVFLPQSMLRYSYIHLTHLIGGIAFYYLFLKLLKNKNGALIGALFYLFNIGIIQMYFAPLEVFATHYASLPIMGLALINAVKSKTKLSLILLGIASFLTSPQAFVPTVFIAYSIFAGILLIFNFKKTLVKRFVLIATILFITNAFWLLPFSYTAIAKSDVIKNTRINEFSSDEIYFRNQARGNLTDVATLKGFMLDTIEYDTFKKENFYFMGAWSEYLQSIPAQVISYIFAGLMLFGSFIVVRFRLKSLYPILVANFVSFFFLANNTPVIANLNEVLRNSLPIFGEAFRFPFTKFITLFAFTYAFLFGLGAIYFIKIITNLIHKFSKREMIAKIAYPAFISVVVLLILFNASIAFKGQFTSPFLRLAIPDAYLNTIDYFNNENPNGRILNFPLNSFWNWEYRNWGHRGSGFMWYALPQSYISRAFDPWSNENEQLYNEVASAYSNNKIEEFDALLEKYGITHIAVDKSILNTLTSKAIDYTKVEEFLNSSTILNKKEDFGLISFYKGGATSQIGSLSRSTLRVYPDAQQTNSDNIYKKGLNYVIDSKADVVIPLTSISTLKLQKDNEFEWAFANDVLTLKSKLENIDTSGKKLVLPSIFEKEFLVPVSIATGQNTVIIQPLYPTVIVNGENMTPTINPIILNSTLVSYPTSIKFVDTNTTITIEEGIINAYILNNFPNTIEVSDGTNTEYFEVDTSNMDKNPQIVEVPEKIDSFQVLVPIVDTDLGKKEYISTKDYVITPVVEELRKTNSNNSSKEENGIVNLQAINSSISVDIYLEPQYHSASYAVIADVERKSGLPVNFYVDDPWSSKTVLETKFDDGKNIVILPATDSFSKGYGYHFGAKSVGTELSSADIKRVSISPLPQKTIESMRLIKTDYLESFPAGNMTNQKYEFFGNSWYKTPSNQSIVTLSQSYDPGWKAYLFNSNNGSGFMKNLKQALPFVFGKEVNNHLKVNNWANGWEVNSDSELVIVYLPQYLQYLGFILLLIPFGYLLLPYFSYILKPLIHLDRYFKVKGNFFKKQVHLRLAPAKR